MAEYSVGVKIKLLIPQDIKSQIKQIQDKIDSQDLKFNIGISPEVMKGLERLGKLSQDVANKINKQKIDWSTGDFQSNLDKILNGLSRFGTVTSVVKNDFGKVTITVEDELNKIKKYVLQANKETEKLNRVSYEETDRLSGNTISKATNEQLKQEIKLQEQKRDIYEKSMAQMQASYKPVQQQIKEIIALRQKEIEQLQKQAETRVNNNQKQVDSTLNEELKIRRKLNDEKQKEIKAEQDLAHYIKIKTQELQSQLAIMAKRRGNLVDNNTIGSLNNGIIDLQSVKNMDEATKKVQNLKAELKNVDTKAFVQGFDAANNHTMSLAQSIEVAAFKMGIWLGMGNLFFGLVSQLSKSFTFLIDVDRRFTTLQMEMTDTNLNFTQLTKTANDYAIAMGTTTDKVVEAIDIFGNYNATLDETLQRSQAAVIMSNITGDTIKNSSDAILAMQQQFGYTSEQSMRLVDYILGVSRNLQVDFPDAVKQTAEGIQKVGEVSNDAGIPLTRLAGMMGTVAEKTRQTGDVIGNAYKTIKILKVAV